MTAWSSCTATGSRNQQNAFKRLMARSLCERAIATPLPSRQEFELSWTRSVFFWPFLNRWRNGGMVTKMS